MKILHLISSPRGEASFSVKLGRAIVSELQSAHPDHTLTTHDLTTTPFPHLEEAHITSFFTPEEKGHQRLLKPLNIRTRQLPN
ncbi:NAD(P)H-dependent oxidoreductase [Mucilaginibacter sp. P25]|uniref:NAD(P)H-dependent oxidoreductase n=1 Tax=Mucilaginibacter sp. P25 TaxID=3423945 RepID=UPI003D7A186C